MSTQEQPRCNEVGLGSVNTQWAPRPTLTPRPHRMSVLAFPSTGRIIVPSGLAFFTTGFDFPILKYVSSSARFHSMYTKIGTIQRRLAWPLRKDDTQIREAFHIFLICVNVWQKPLQYCKVISLQLIKINEKLINKICEFPKNVERNENI